MALFDLGDVEGSLKVLREAVDLSRVFSEELQFSTTFALFVREGDYQSPEAAVPGLSILRQLASSLGNAKSLAGLHLAVARLEGFQGNCVNAHRHLEIARHFTSGDPQSPIRLSLDLVEASLESIAGNLVRSRQVSESCLRSATAVGFSKYQVAALSNLAVVATQSGNFAAARESLTEVLRLTRGLTYVTLAASDSLAGLELREGNTRAAGQLLDSCTGLIANDQAPARSWYEFAVELTRCAYFEKLQRWDDVLRVVERIDDELAERRYRALRTTALSAKARALGHLGRHAAADAALTAASRACPRGAVDPLIVLEASKGICLGLRGEHEPARLHVDRALAVSRAIGHKAHETWIEQERAALPLPAALLDAPPHRLDVIDTSLLLGDVATILGAGHSIDLLANRLAALLQATPMASRVDIRSESGHEYRPDPSATWESEADGVFRIHLRGSDRLISIAVRDVRTIDEISLVKSLADIIRVAVNRTREAEDDRTLWPRATSPAGDDTIFRSPRMAELVKIGMRLAATNLPVLITGETGTGKEIFARLIHEHSAVKRGPFVAFNCSAVPRDLVESQLFGHRRGAFTGAVDAFPGVVRGAEHGTLFLDEIGDLDPGVQPKLLRFLEYAEIQSVGEARTQRVSVRVVAATNADVDDLVEQGRFRRDLFYRLGVARLVLPPLRERKDEIPAFASLFLTRYARECQRSGLRLSDDLIAALLLYDWPGNIRQLANEIRRIVALAHDGDTLTAAHLAPDVAHPWRTRGVASADGAAPTVTIRLDQTLAEATDALERVFIERALETASGRVAEAAQILGLSRKGLFLKRRRRGMVAKAAGD
jgi:DNA-binding NtrC family response regulator